MPPRPTASTKKTTSANPTKATSSPRPKANPEYSGSSMRIEAPATAAASKNAAAASKYTVDRTSKSGPTPLSLTSAKPGVRKPIPPKPPAGQTPGDPVDNRAPNNPASIRNPNLPADSVQASRGERRPDSSFYDKLTGQGASRSAQKYRGSALGPIAPKVQMNVYGQPITNQQFNGPRGSKTVLGQ
jgi:hypothetical protein